MDGERNLQSSPHRSSEGQQEIGESRSPGKEGYENKGDRDSAAVQGTRSGSSASIQ
jgi:hypothetical protein